MWTTRIKYDFVLNTETDENAKKEKGRAPRFIQPITPQIVPEEEVVIMEVEVDSSPVCTFQWLHNDFPVKVSLNVYYIQKRLENV